MSFNAKMSKNIFQLVPPRKCIFKLCILLKFSPYIVIVYTFQSTLDICVYL